MTVTYSVIVPFQLADDREISSPTPFNGESGGYPAELRHQIPYYAVHLQNIPSEEDAKEQFSRLIVGLYWAAVEYRSGILVKSELQQPHYPDNPIEAVKNMFGEATDYRAEVIVDGAMSAILPGGMKIVTSTGQSAKLVMSYSPAKFLETLGQGMMLPNPYAVLTSVKLRLAIELYCLAHFRASDFARFLVLCVVLETLAPEGSQSAHTVDLLDQWMKDAKARASALADGSTERDELESLANRMGYLKNQSHRGRIRQLVKSQLMADGQVDADDAAREATRLYDVRSGLVHTGKYELGNDLAQLDLIVCRVLKAAMRNA